MKKNVKAYLFKWCKRVKSDEENYPDPVKIMDVWPDIRLCVDCYYKNHPEMKQYHDSIKEPLKLAYTEGFLRSLNKNCKTRDLRIKLIYALTLLVYKIPNRGLHDTPIKERSDLWHFYVSDSWRVFYRKKNNHILLEEFCSHKKLSYHRRH